MTKIVVCPNNKSDIEKIIDKVDAILLGIKDFSVNFLDIELEELESIVNYVHSKDKEIFISLNKNFHNPELQQLEEILRLCCSIKVDGIFYYDVALINLKNKLNLTVPLIWSAEHLTTNAYTINYWHQEGIDGVFLSNEITKQEIEDICKQVCAKVFVQCFGYLPMYVSERHAVKNYLEHFNIKTDKKKFRIEKEGKSYPIIERKIDTEIYSSFMLNALEEFLSYKNISYAYINGYELDTDSLLKVLDVFNIVNEDNVYELSKQLDSLFNTGKGFLYKETIYQVKK